MRISRMHCTSVSCWINLVFMFTIAWPTHATAHDTNHENIKFLQPRQDGLAGNTTCANSTVTWWNNADGLNPCQQYEKLRQLCEAGYTLPSIKQPIGPDQPPTTCTSQLKHCCCNSIAFNLAMVCASCQSGVGSGRGDPGIDAPSGTYQAYLGTCLPHSQNQTLDTTTQTAVCSSKLDLPRYLYENFWTAGTFFYEWTFEYATVRSQANLTSSGKCVANHDGTQALLNNVGGRSDIDDDSNKYTIVAIVGGILGALGLISTIAVLLWFKFRGNKRQTSSAKRYPAPPLDLDRQVQMQLQNFSWDRRDSSSSTPFLNPNPTSHSRSNSGFTDSIPGTPTPFLSRPLPSGRNHSARSSVSSISGLPDITTGAPPSHSERRDEKLRALEAHPSGKRAIPYPLPDELPSRATLKGKDRAVELDLPSGSRPSNRRGEKLAILGAGGSGKREEAELHSSRRESRAHRPPPSYVTQVPSPASAPRSRQH